MKIFHFLRHLWRKYSRVDWIATIRINRKLPFRQMLKMPIWVYGCKIKTIKGNIQIDSNYIKPGMLRLGLLTSGLCGNTNGLFLDIMGTLIFKGPGYMGNNSAIEIGKEGTLIFGPNFGITGALKIVSKESITIGKNFSCSWEVSIFDTDFHTLVNLENNTKLPMNGPVYIGDDVWCCQRTTILKNSYIPNRCIIASNTLVNKNFSEIFPNSIIAGIPAKLKKANITREEFLTFEKNPLIDITRLLHLD